MKIKTKSSKKKRNPNSPNDSKSSASRKTVESRDLNEDEQQQITNGEPQVNIQGNNNPVDQSEDDDDKSSTRLNTKNDLEEDHERITGEGDEIEDDNKTVKE